MKWLAFFIIVFVLIAGTVLFHKHGRSVWVPVWQKFKGKQTTETAVKSIGPAAEARNKSYFRQQGIPYPPQSITLIGLKREKILELWAGGNNQVTLARKIPILAASGKLGPKLKEGDRQVPEGIYQITWLNPNSSYYLSMMINYPNEFDRSKARIDGRTKLGDNIFIHGKNVSIGCLAIGDEAIEDLFALVKEIGMSKTRVIIAPYDFRAKPYSTQNISDISWLGELYDLINKKIQVYKNP